jgi:hypothetical protein
LGRDAGGAECGDSLSVDEGMLDLFSLMLYFETCSLILVSILATCRQSRLDG